MVVRILVFVLITEITEGAVLVGSGYTIKRCTIDGGGSQLSGNGYSLNGTVGQFDPGILSGGRYTLTGGFWSPFSVVPCPIPEPDPSDVMKARFVSFEPSSCASRSGGESAYRINLISLHHVVPPYTGGPSIPFTSFEGQVRWVGPPLQYVESTANPTPFYAATLQCTPYYQDWSTVGLLHVTGSAIVPSSVYEVENVAASCQGNETNCTAVSAPLTVATTRWGDVETPYSPPNPGGQPDFGDVAALVNKFKSGPGAPIKARALLVGDDAFGNISPTTIGLDFGFNHIAACVDAFKGKPYPHTIGVCP